MDSLALRLPKELHSKLEHLANATHRAQSELVRLWLETYLDDPPPVQPQEQVYTSVALSSQQKQKLKNLAESQGRSMAAVLCDIIESNT